jgi:hypothetical protein
MSEYFKNVSLENKKEPSGSKFYHLLDLPMIVIRRARRMRSAKLRGWRRRMLPLAVGHWRTNLTWLAQISVRIHPRMRQKSRMRPGSRIRMGDVRPVVMPVGIRIEPSPVEEIPLLPVVVRPVANIVVMLVSAEPADYIDSVAVVSRTFDGLRLV